MSKNDPVAEFWAWLDAAAPGQLRIYHVGELPNDRQRNFALSDVAGAVFQAHARGLVYPFQKRMTQETEIEKGVKPYCYFVLRSAKAAQSERVVGA